MQYDLSLFSVSDELPSCFIATSQGNLTLYYNLALKKREGVLFNGQILPVGDFETVSEVPTDCLSTSILKHDDWTSVVFPFLSLIIIIFSLAMIYHIIFKRIFP